jgi:hypothetical protein
MFYEHDAAFDVGLRDSDKMMAGPGRLVNRLSLSIVIAVTST